MSHNFKPGGLALVIGSSQGISPNIGISVELVQVLESGGLFVLPNGRRIRSAGPLCWVVYADGAVGQLGNGSFADVGGFTLCQEIYLMPLRGDLTPDQQKAKEADPCV